jgi:hypothetical protein
MFFISVSGMEKNPIRDGKKSDPGWKKFGIWDVYPGSATLPYTNVGSGSRSPRSGLKIRYNVSTD